MDELEAAIELGPENEDQLARLRRALILGDGFQIVFLELSHPRLAKEVLRRLRRWSGKDGVPELAIVRTRPGRDPVAPLRHLTGGAVLVGIDQPFDGLERELVTLDDDGGPEARVAAQAETAIERTMTTLNWFRDELPSLVQGPLVLVLSPDGLRRLFVHAPDLLAWRSHTTRITLPRLTVLEIRPRPSRRASLEEKAWLEKMIASADANAGGALARELPGWLIRLGEIEAREGGPWEQRLARAEELAVGRPEILFKVQLARARCEIDEGRLDDASRHLGEAVKLIVAASGEAEQDAESMLETTGWGAAARTLWVRVAVNEHLVVLAEWMLRTGHIEDAARMAESALLGARAFGDAALVIAALAVAGAVASHHGDRDAAAARFQEMRKMARTAQDRAAESFALPWLAEFEPQAADARRLYLEALSLLDDDDHEARARVCLGVARCAIQLGSPDEAARILSQLAIAELSPMMRIGILTGRAGAAAAQHRLDEALAHVRAAWGELQRTTLPPREQATLGFPLGMIALHTGDIALARDAFRHVAEIAEVLADSELAAAARAGLARAGGANEDTGEQA